MNQRPRKTLGFETSASKSAHKCCADHLISNTEILIKRAAAKPKAYREIREIGDAHSEETNIDRTWSKLVKFGWAIAAVYFFGGFPQPTLLAVGFRLVDEGTPKPTTDTPLNSL